MKNNIKHVVQGIEVDAKTRCAHYNSIVDIIAIKFKCCDEYYSCIYCHQDLANHPVITWNKNEFDLHVVLCGFCNTEMTINEYFSSNNCCPSCKSSYNPKCVNQHHNYFDMKDNN